MWSNAERMKEDRVAARVTMSFCGGSRGTVRERQLAAGVRLGTWTQLNPPHMPCPLLQRSRCSWNPATHRNAVNTGRCNTNTAHKSTQKQPPILPELWGVTHHIKDKRHILKFLQQKNKCFASVISGKQAWLMSGIQWMLGSFRKAHILLSSLRCLCSIFNTEGPGCLGWDPLGKIPHWTSLVAGTAGDVFETREQFRRELARSEDSKLVVKIYFQGMNLSLKEEGYRPPRLRN